MDLDAYLAEPGAQSLTALSAAVGISKGRLSQLRRATDWPAELAMRIERATDGAVDAGRLSPVVAEARRTSPNDPASPQSTGDDAEVGEVSLSLPDGGR